MNASFGSMWTSVGTLLNNATRSIKPPIVTGSSTSICTFATPSGTADGQDPQTICCLSAVP